MKCRHCTKELDHTFLDLGFAPPSNAYLTGEDLSKPEVTLPLRLRVCDSCWLVQTEDYAKKDLFFNAEYAYFSSTSTTWLEHAARYAETIINDLALDSNSFVIEIASNDGYLLKNFVERHIPCLGIEPTTSTADAAEKIGIPVLRQFFGAEMAGELRKADLICGNNVYAHVPDINDFTRGLKIALAPNGTITLEFPHLMRLIELNQFDTVYHEHFSYLSLIAVQHIFQEQELKIYKVDELPTHGGSLRIYGCHEDDPRNLDPSVDKLLKVEEDFGLTNLERYLAFQAAADKVKNNFLAFLIEQKRLGKKVVAYGAAAKGNTLLNYAGIKPDLLQMVCDLSASKQGKFMPGSHIPIVSLERLRREKPDFIVILPWNIKDEVLAQEGPYVAKWGGQFIVAVPKLEVISA